MTKSVLYHLHAIRITFTELLKGKFLVFFLPGILLSACYYGVLYWLSLEQEEMTFEKVDIGWIDCVLSWVNDGVLTAFTLIDLIFYQVYIFAVLTLLSPFYTQLSERLDSDLTEQTFKSGLLRFINDFFRMIFVVCLALITELAFILVYWTLSLFLGSAILNETVYFLIAAFFFGFTFYDFSLERYKKGIFDTFTFAFSSPLKSMLTGCIFLLIFKIPYLGPPLAPVLAVMISTIVYLYDVGKLPRPNTSKTTLE